MSVKEKQHTNYKDNFRDAISTVDTHGKRIWIYPKKPKGKFYNYRKLVSYVLLVFLFAGPFLTIGGEPLLMLNLIERKFVIFGSLFVPQDFHIFVLVMLLTFVGVVLFTVAFGRIWCGWTCPQTIFMEMVFRRIEYWIEGDMNQQKKLKKTPWNSEKILKKTSKHTIFFAISFLIANMFLGYIVGGKHLLDMVTSSPKDNATVFIALVIFTFVFYYVFARFREQVCTTFCPYGRLQGVFLDKHSINISYDYVRGEPRGNQKKANKKQADTLRVATEADMIDTLEAPKLGDCIDCGACVKVCPTGIDIRNGTQMECINCTACIDACDEIMDKVEKPRGLIRYASEEEIANNQKFKFTIRMIAYSGVLLVLFGVLGYMLSSRSAIETTILRAPGQMYQTTDKGDIRNLYTIQVVNKTENDYPLTLKLKQPSGKITVVQDEFGVEGNDYVDGACFIEIPKANLDGLKTKLVIEIYANNELLETVSTTFVGPIQ